MASYRNTISGFIYDEDQTVELPYRHFGNGAAAVQVSGDDFTGTMEFQMRCLDDPDAWVPVLGVNVATGDEVAEITSAGIYRFEAVGASGFRVIATDWTVPSPAPTTNYPPTTFTSVANIAEGVAYLTIVALEG